MKTNDQKADEAKSNVKGKLYSGIFLIIAGVLILFVQSTYVALTIVFVIAGIVVSCMGAHDLLRIKNFYYYKELIGEKNEICIADFAKRVQSDVDIVTNDLRWMMEQGFFEDVEIIGINEFFRSKTHYKWKVNTVVSNKENDVKQNLSEKETWESYKEQEETQYYVEVCDCCGGTTKIKVGGGAICDYCGAPIGKYKNLH